MHSWVFRHRDELDSIYGRSPTRSAAPGSIASVAGDESLHDTRSRSRLRILAVRPLPPCAAGPSRERRS